MTLLGVELASPEGRPDIGADDPLQVHLHRLVVEVVAQDVGASDHVLLGALADGGVIDRVDPEGAGEVFGEAAVGGACLDQLQGDCLADLLLAGGGGLLSGLRSGLGGHDLSLSLPRRVAGPMPASSPSGAVFWGRARRPRKPLRTAVVREWRQRLHGAVRTGGASPAMTGALAPGRRSGGCSG